MTGTEAKHGGAGDCMLEQSMQLLICMLTRAARSIFMHAYGPRRTLIAVAAPSRVVKASDVQQVSRRDANCSCIPMVDPAGISLSSGSGLDLPHQRRNYEQRMLLRMR